MKTKWAIIAMGLVSVAVLIKWEASNPRPRYGSGDDTSATLNATPMIDFPPGQPWVVQATSGDLGNTCMGHRPCSFPTIDIVRNGERGSRGVIFGTDVLRNVPPGIEGAVRGDDAVPMTAERK